MIIELCGLPASGKSTCIGKFIAAGENLGIDFEVISPRKFYPTINMNALSIILGLTLCIKNVVLEPKLSLFIIVEIMKKHKLLTQFTYFKIFICIQYHINWILLFKGILAKKNHNRLVLLDGSPWNIINDFPGCDASLINKILPIYLSNVNTITIFSNPDVKLCHKLMMKRKSQPLEKKLYGNIKNLKNIKKSFDVIYLELKNKKGINLDIKYVNLHKDNEVEDLLDYVIEKYKTLHRT